jgi:hypothetical protein
MNHSRLGIAGRNCTLQGFDGEIRGATTKARRATWGARSTPIVSELNSWLERQLTFLPQRSGLADAIRYTLARWTALCRFLEDGRMDLDTDTVERAIRPVTLGRKNHLFAGSEGGAERWAAIATLITTAKLNDVEPQAWLTDIFTRLTDGLSMNRIDDLLPWNWSKA